MRRASAVWRGAAFHSMAREALPGAMLYALSSHLRPCFTAENGLHTRRIDILSDSTGETAEKVVRAAMLQFPQSGGSLRLHTRVRTREAVRPVLENAAKDGALVVFTVVSPELREYIHAQSYELKVEAVDLIGSLIGKLGLFLDQQPINTPSGMLPLTEEYFRRIEALEFAVKSDDGKEPRNFKKADLVLCGVSRTSKTPLSTLLAQRGLKVANYPIVPGVRIPPELDEAPQDRVVGLTIEVDQLVEIRKARLEQLGMPKDAGYGLRDQIRQELDYARLVFAKHPSWPVIDVTGRAVEETAVVVLESLKERDDKNRKARAATV
jgi:regulator of PEP synthase PpsR (kinase-PPPase family)